MTTTLARRVAFISLVVLLTGSVKSLLAQESDDRRPVRFQQDSIEVAVGDTILLPIRLPGVPEERMRRPLQWTSADTSIARITEDGRLTTRRLESTWIIASSREVADSILVAGGVALTDKAFVVDSTVLTLVSSPEQLEEGLFEFTLRSDTTDRPQPGNIIVGNQRGGFLRQVEGVEPLSRHQILVFTSDATLPDVLLAGTIDINVPLTLPCSSDDLLAYSDRADVQLASWTELDNERRSPTPPSSALACQIELSEPNNRIRYGPARLLDLDPNATLSGGGVDFILKANTSPLSLSLEGSIVPRARASLDYKVNRFLRVPRGVEHVDLRFASSLEGSMRAFVAITDSSTSENERELASFERPFAGSVGPLPVAGRITVTLYAGYTAEGDTELTLRSGRQRITSEIGTHLRWEDGSWGALETRRHIDIHPAPVRYNGNASLLSRVYVRPALQFTLYEVAGPAASLMPYMEGRATVRNRTSSECSLAADLSTGIDGSVGITWTRFASPVANLLGVRDVEREFRLAQKSITSSLPRNMACP